MNSHRILSYAFVSLFCGLVACTALGWLPLALAASGGAALTVRHKDGTVSAYYAGADTDTARAALLLSWCGPLGNIRDGDIGFPAAGTYDFGNSAANHCDLSHGGLLTGSIVNLNSTPSSVVFKSAYVAGNKGFYVVEPGLLHSRIMGITIQCTAPVDQYCQPTGSHGAWDVVDAGWINNTIIGGTDGILMLCAHNCSGFSQGNVIQSRWDSITLGAPDGGSATWTSNGDKITVTAEPVHKQTSCWKGAVAGSGVITINLVNSTACTLAGYGMNLGVLAGAHVTVNMQSGSIDSTAASGFVYDIDIARGGIGNIYAGFKYNPARVLNSGTINYF